MNSSRGNHPSGPLAKQATKRLRLRIGLRLFMLLCLLSSILAAWLGLRAQVQTIDTRSPNGRYVSLGPDGGVHVDNRGVAHAASVHGRGLHRLNDKSQVVTINLGDARVEDLAVLCEFPALRTVRLTGSTPRLTREAVAHLARCSQLEQLSAADVRDEHVEGLAQLAGLEHLLLDFSPITDAGVEHLAELKTLRILRIHGAAMTPEGIARLRAALPQCTIVVVAETSLR